LTCRKRQIASNSFFGNARVFSRSRYEERVLIPGFEDRVFSVGIRGGVGGRGNGDVAVRMCWGAPLTAGNGMEAFFLRCWILSLYASFNSVTSRSPSLKTRVSADILWFILYSHWLTLLPSAPAFPCTFQALYRIAGWPETEHHEPEPIVAEILADMEQLQI
jgi:hypothetical protein